MSESTGSFHPFEVTAVHLIYVGLGIFIVLFGMFSLFIKEKLYLGEAPLAAIFGIIIGPVALNLFNPSGWANNETASPGGHITNEITLEVMRVTIALSVFAVGVELPKKYLLRHWRSIALLLGPVMVWGWLITAAFMYALVPGLDFLNCLVVASCVTPTDPILAQAVVGGPWAEKHVPTHLRHMLMCESGCNDGAAFPFLYLALYLTVNRDNHGKAIAEWFYDAWAYQIIFGTILGALIGWAARKLMRFSERHRLVDRESFVAQYVSLAIASMGVNVLLGSDDLLAAFACGTAFAWDGWFTRQTEDSNFSSIVDLLFNVATFIYIGALMPFREFAGGSVAEPNTLSIWRLFVLAICVLITKRMPIVVLLWRWIPDIKTFREAIFAGHFGPIGVGAIFIATLARTQLPEEVAHPPETSNDILALTVQPIIFFFVLCSIIIHGLTIPFFAFSRRATTITRTWSRNPSFITGDNEPSWVSRIRRTKTGESVSPEEGNMTEIERVLNAQLGKIGRGAIGGDAEKELRKDQSSDEMAGTEEESNTHGPDSVRSRVGLYNARTERELKGVSDDYEEDHTVEKEDPMGEWGGDDTIEMKRYRERMQEKKAAEYANLRREQQERDGERRASEEERQRDGRLGDLGMADVGSDGEERGPMDRDLNAEDKERALEREGMARWGCGEVGDSSDGEHAAQTAEREREESYPKSRTWVEGSKLVIEYQKSKSADPEVTVIPLLDEERESIGSSDEPAHAWVQAHATNIERHLGLTDVASWHPSESANHLMHHRIPHLYNDYLSRRPGPAQRRGSVVESKEDRDRRSRLLFESMNWASERRDEGGRGEEAGKAGGKADGKAKRERRRPVSPDEVEAPISGWLSSPGGPSRPRKQRSPSSPSRGSGPVGTAKQYVCRPSASDSRRMTLRKKLRAGELSLSKGRHPAEEAFEEPDMEVVDSPGARNSRSTSKAMARYGSAGGLGGARSDRILQPSSTSSSFLQIPRTDTTDSTSSDRGRGGSGRGHSKSNSVQWLDVGDSSHDHLSERMATEGGRLATGGQTPRNTSRNPSPARSNRKEDESQAGGRKRHRISSLFSSFTPSSSSARAEQPSSPSATPSVRVMLEDEDGEDGSLRRPQQPLSQGDGGILAPPSRTATGSETPTGNSQGVTFRV